MLLLLVFACGLSSHAYSQAGAECQRAAAMWIPPADALQRVVEKWNDKIEFSIIARNEESAMVKDIRNTIRFATQLSGLQFSEMDSSEKSAVPDILVVVVPDVKTNSDLLRDMTQRFFQARDVRRRRVQIDATGWEKAIKSFLPKCTAAVTNERGRIEQAFVVIQEGESSSCIRIGLLEAFGIVEIRRHYELNGYSVPDAIVSAALRGLYSKEIEAGMSRSEAEAKVERACR